MGLNALQIARTPFSGIFFSCRKYKAILRPTEMMITLFYSRQETNWWYWWKALQYFFKLFKEHHILYLGICSQVYKYTLFRLLLAVLRMQFHMKQLVNSKQWWAASEPKIWSVSSERRLQRRVKEPHSNVQYGTRQLSVHRNHERRMPEKWKKKCLKIITENHDFAISCQSMTAKSHFSSSSRLWIQV